MDLLFETAQGMQAVEVKSGSTFASDPPAAPLKWQKFTVGEALSPVIVDGEEGGGESQGRGLWGGGSYRD